MRMITFRRETAPKRFDPNYSCTREDYDVTLLDGSVRAWRQVQVLALHRQTVCIYSFRHTCLTCFKPLAAPIGKIDQPQRYGFAWKRRHIDAP